MEDMLQELDQEQRIDQYIRRIFKVDDITQGTEKLGFLLRYRGHLYSKDSEKVYDDLAAFLKPMGFTPLFRIEDKRQAILIVKGLPEPKPANRMVNLILFILTIFSVLFTGFIYGSADPLPENFFSAVLTFFERGWPFALSILAILGAHELGHYFAGRRHGLNVTLPYFIPMPFSPFGTMGAFISMKGVPKNRKHLLDVGIAGPLSGLIVAIPVLLLGLSLSEVTVLQTGLSQTLSLQLEGNSLIYLLSKYVVFGQLLPQPADFGGLSPLLYWIKYLFTGQPLPLGGVDVLLHPVAWAGWAGLLVTGLNLIPAGQLDGGHVFYVLFGNKWAQRFYPFIIVFLIAMGFFWNGWWLWAGILFLFGRMHAEVLDQITPLDGKRKFLAGLVLVLFLLTFTPVPLIIA